MLPRTIAVSAYGSPRLTSGRSILFSRTDKYDVRRGGEFFQYLQFQFLLVERQGDSPATKPIYEGSQPRLVEVSKLTGSGNTISLD
jgi:hypothetical protein